MNALSVTARTAGMESAASSHGGVFHRVHLMLSRKSQANSAVDQERSKQIKNPVEAFDQADPSKNKDAAHEQRSDDSPEQHASLVLLGNGEIAEDHEEDEEIVDAEGEFENVAGDEFQCDLAPLPEK